MLLEYQSYISHSYVMSGCISGNMNDLSLLLDPFT